MNGELKMPSEYQHETLQAALVAGGYDEKAVKVAAVAAQRGLGVETTVNLISGIDGAAARIAEQILGDQAQPQVPASEMTPEQTQATASNWLNNVLLEGTGRASVGGGEE